MKVEEAEKLRDIRRAYILAKALNIQYQWIREFISPELKKSINNAKAGNSFFIKQIEEAFLNRRVDKEILLEEEERAFKLLEKLEEKLEEKSEE